MKVIITYICAIALTVFVVAMSVLVPPYFAEKQDAAFLGVVKMDENQSESFKYKATKYQKTKVLYEAVAQQYEEWGMVEGISQTAGPEEAPKYGENVWADYTEGIPGDAVMTRGQAENAVAREARKLQSAGALPKFDLGPEGDYSAVSSIAFLTVTDRAAANAKFYFWEGRIEIDGGTYRFIIDDDIGKVYFMDIMYYANAKDTKDPAEIEKEVGRMVGSFAQYHEFEVGARNYFDFGAPDYGPEFFSRAEYQTSDRDFNVSVRQTGVWNTGWRNYMMLLMPSELS